MLWPGVLEVPCSAVIGVIECSWCSGDSGCGVAVPCSAPLGIIDIVVLQASARRGSNPDRSGDCRLPDLISPGRLTRTIAPLLLPGRRGLLGGVRRVGRL